MKERKYKEEYKLITQLDEKTGKPRQIPVYMGDDYIMTADVRGKMLVSGGAYLAGFALAYGAYMLGNSPSSRCIYVLPFACCAVIPLLYAVMGMVSSVRAPERMTRVQRETGIGRLMRSFLGCGCFGVLAALGDVIFMARNGFSAEWLYALALLGCGALGLAGFACMRTLYNGMRVLPGKASREAGKKAGDAP